MCRLALTLAFFLAGASSVSADPPISEKDRKDSIDGILKALEREKSQLQTRITVLESDERDAKKDLEARPRSKAAKEKHEQCDKSLNQARNTVAKLLADPTLMVPFIHSWSRPGETIRIGSAEAIFLKTVGTDAYVMLDAKNLNGERLVNGSLFHDTAAKYRMPVVVKSLDAAKQKPGDKIGISGVYRVTA
jgi:hypothetical protein